MEISRLLQLQVNLAEGNFNIVHSEHRHHLSPSPLLAGSITTVFLDHEDDGQTTEYYEPLVGVVTRHVELHGSSPSPHICRYRE